MKCSCGTMVQLSGPSGYCQSCGRQHLSCPTCGAHIATNADAVVVQCLYCDTQLQHTDLSRGAPYFTVHFSEVEMQTRLLTFLLNRFGIPGDFQRNFRVLEQNLVYVPVHLYQVCARLNELIYEIDTKAVIATEQVYYRRQLENYHFAMRAKVYTDPRKIRGGVYPPELSREAADREAYDFGNELLKRDKERFDEVAKNENIHLDYQGMVYYPLYEVTYGYGSKHYRSVFDASNGVVCHTEHESENPRGAKGGRPSVSSADSDHHGGLCPIGVQRRSGLDRPGGSRRLRWRLHGADHGPRRERPRPLDRTK